MTGDGWALRLASGERIAERLMLVVAHPDDETLWAGATLRRLDDLTLVLVTDGAPEDMGDAHRLGMASRADYAAVRAAELAAALVALGARPRLLRYEMPDQAAVHHVAAIAERLVRDGVGAAAIVTHPYEGGHPDHDATALAAHLAAARLGVPVVEFACYARFDGTRVFARFVAHDACAERTRALDDDDRARLEAGLAAHASQASVFGDWRPDAERWRAAPAYDFAAAPPGEGVLYDGFGWAMTSARWRALTSSCLPR